MKRFGLIGHPLGHSLSPAIHACILRTAGIEGTYDLYDVAPEDLANRLPALMAELDGFNCTIPHKQSLMSHIQALDVTAQRCGAVNTVAGGVGYNTDIEGFLASELVLTDRDVLLLGTGGTSHMMGAMCLEKGCRSLTIRSRDASKAFALAAHLGRVFPEAADRCHVAEGGDSGRIFDVILNGTPVGMWPNAGGLPCETTLLQPGVAVFDAIYNPIATRLVLNARRRGARAQGGLRMLVRQAVAAQQIWNPDVVIDALAVEAAVLPELTAALLRDFPVKILLTGFMGCGKSTVSRLLAEQLGLDVVDLDAEIVRSAGQPIAEIFAERSETGFRALEAEVAESVLRSPRSAVVAAGGGLPISEANQAMIRRTNTLVVNIDIPFETAWQRIAADSARPLASNRLRAEALYAARTHIYDAFCDFNTETKENPEDVAATIAAALTSLG